MLIRLVPVAVALGLLGACNPTPQPAANQASAAPSPAAAPTPANATAPQPSADSELREWLVGAWSFEDSCATDFVVHYNSDGTLDNSGDLGTWSANGAKVTEVITRRFTSGSEEAENVDPPETRSYTVARTDQSHGVLTLEQRSVAILRC